MSIKTSLFIFMGPGALKINFVIGPQKNVVFFNLCHLLLTLFDLEVTWSIFFCTGQVLICLQISILILGSKNQVEERRVLLSIKRTQSHDSLTLAPKSPTHLHLGTSKVYWEKRWQEKIELIWMFPKFFESCPRCEDIPHSLVNFSVCIGCIVKEAP